jgi:hypothetical protein
VAPGECNWFERRHVQLAAIYPWMFVSCARHVACRFGAISGVQHLAGALGTGSSNHARGPNDVQSLDALLDGSPTADTDASLCTDKPMTVRDFLASLIVPSNADLLQLDQCLVFRGLRVRMGLHSGETTSHRSTVCT